MDKSEDEESPPQCVPNWLIEVLAWINRIEMAKSSISISCRLFYKLCYSKLHGNVKPHIVSGLVFFHATKTLKLEKPNIPFRDLEDIPIATTPPPHYILGFESVYFGFIDAEVLEFLKNILPLISSRILRFAEYLGLLHRRRICQFCGATMTLRQPKDEKRYGTWRCQNKAQHPEGKTLEIGFLQGTFFAGSHLTTQQIFALTYYWAHQYGRQEDIKHELKINDHTIVDWRIFKNLNRGFQDIATLPPNISCTREVRIVTDDIRQFLAMLTSIGEIVWQRWNFLYISLQDFQLHFPGLLDNIQILSIDNWLPWNRHYIDIILNWLIKPRTDGKPKILYFKGRGHEWKMALIKRIKKEFCNSTHPITFLIHFDRDVDLMPFDMENGRTGEVLLMIEEESDDSDNVIGFYLLRCPNGTEKEWKEEGKKLYDHSNIRNVTIFKLGWERKIKEYTHRKKRNIFSKCIRK